MKTNNRTWMLAIAACTALLISTGLYAQNAESDFETDGKGTITKYAGWDSKVVIPAKIGGKPVTAIGERAFEKSDLTSVTIPDTVKTIGESAFSGNKLTSVTLGKGLTVIGKEAFSSNQLTEITIPDSVTYIGESAFDNNKLTSVTISGSARIGGSAFCLTSTAKSVTLGANLVFDILFTGLEFNASVNLFSDYVCNDRKAGTYTLDEKRRDSKKDGDFEYNETKYGAYITDYSGSSGNRLQIPDKVGGLAVKAIGGFREKGISRVRIPDSVTFIGDSAFYGNQLTSVTIPNSVTYIGESAFESNKLTEITIPNGVTFIGNFAFYRNQLTSVAIPNGVTVIGDFAFRENQLTSVAIPNSVTLIGDSAFYRNQLTSVTIGSGVTVISKGAFGNNELTSVTIPNSVTLIGDSAFERNKLTSVTIPNSVIVIGLGAFAFCSSLTTVTISPVQGRTWGLDPFYNCPKLDLKSQAAIKAAGYTDGF